MSSINSKRPKIEEQITVYGKPNVLLTSKAKEENFRFKDLVATAKSQDSRPLSLSSMQVMNKLCTDQHCESYYNSIRSQNKARIKSAIHGMKDIQDICYMKVTG